MSGTESPDSAAFDVEVERVECSVKTLRQLLKLQALFYEIKIFMK